METPEINPVDHLIGDIANAANNWMEEQRKSLPAEITKRLNKSRDEILMKILGFDKDSWNGQWKLDHCNGRSGNSAAGEYLAKVQAEAVKNWLDQVAMPVMTPALKKDLEKGLQQQYEMCAHDAINSIAKRQAEQDINALVSEIVQSKQIDNFLKLRTLITPT